MPTKQAGMSPRLGNKKPTKKVIQTPKKDRNQEFLDNNQDLKQPMSKRTKVAIGATAGVLGALTGAAVGYNAYLHATRYEITIQTNVQQTEAYTMTVRKGSIIGSITPVEIEGYTFQGFYKDANFTEPYNHDDKITKSNVVIYCKYAIKTFTITHPEGTGLNWIFNNGTTVEYNGTLNFQLILTEGYTQSQVKVLANGVELTPIDSSEVVGIFEIPNVKENIVLEVVGDIKLNTYNVEFYAKSTTIDSEYTSWKTVENIEYNSIINQTEVPEPTGYNFSHWVDSEGNRVTNITSANSVYAAYTEEEYLLQEMQDVVISRNGTVINAGEIIKYNEVLEICVAAPVGYKAENIIVTGAEKLDAENGTRYKVTGEISVTYDLVPYAYVVQVYMDGQPIQFSADEGTLTDILLNNTYRLTDGTYTNYKDMLIKSSKESYAYYKTTDLSSLSLQEIISVTTLGLYTDEKYTEQVDLTKTLEEITGSTEDIIQLNLYTKLATLDMLTYTISNNTATVKANANNITVDSTVVLPRAVYKGVAVLSLATIGRMDGDFKYIYIPDSVTSIGNYAFSGCSNLTDIIIPKSVISLGNYVFSNCTSLESIRVVEGNTIYHSSGNCIIETSTKTLIIGCKASIIPDDGTVTSIGSYAFRGCTGLTSVTIGENVTSIGSYAFIDCTGLTSVTIGENVTSIGDSAFSYCEGLTRITIPKGITTIGNWAFSSCTNLTSLIILKGVTHIGNYAFSSCESLTEVTIPNSVVNFGNTIFYNCTKLVNATFEQDIQLTTFPKSMFLGCISLSEIIIPNTVTSIGSAAFKGCTSLLEVIIPSKVTNIGSDAFSGCENINKVIFESELKLKTIGYNAFGGCINLKNINLPSSLENLVDCPGENTDYKKCSIGVFDGCTNLVYNVYDNCNYLGNSENPYLVLISCNNSSATSIEIHPQTKIIYTKAFANQTLLKNVIIGENVQFIRLRAFMGCTSLESVVFNDPNVWYVNSSTTLDLSDAAQNALYLKQTYRFGWSKNTSSYSGHPAMHAY